MTENEFFEKYKDSNLSFVELAEKAVEENVADDRFFWLAHNLLNAQAKLVHYLQENNFTQEK